MKTWPAIAATALLLFTHLASAEEQVPASERPALIKQIEAKREAIEAVREKMQRATLSTSNLRAQIKQKWSKIEFYAENGAVRRIKTYPHESISHRTEEFYFEGGHLIFAYIEDEGMTDEKPGVISGGKAYYYDNGRFVAERNQTGEPEQAIRHSDEERLEQEAMEYLSLYAETQKDH